MTMSLRAAGVIASFLVVTGCATDSKRTAASPSDVTRNSACLTQTGNRIAAKDSNCTEFGRSYSSDDVSRTGATTAGEALRLMDPSVTVHH
jgi:hypothetical protein